MSEITVSRPPGWEPRSRAQKAWLDSIGVIDFLLGGGSAGSLKTSTMLVDAGQEIDNPNLNAAIFRETHRAIEKDIELQAYQLYSQTGGKYNQSEMVWSWPWGSRIQFGYLEKPKDVFNWYGSSLSFLGIDESTFQMEEPIRHLMTMRLRSTDPSLKIRTRLGTNPGQVGAAWHKSLFMGAHCTHCLIDENSRLPNRIYNDARWPSDGKLITGPDGVNAVTTCFIPSWVTEHDLYGAGGGGYAKKMEGLPDRLQKALLAGCWESFEGQYFDCFDAPQMTLLYNELLHAEQEDDRLQWWWPHWVSMDYGFGGSRTSAHLHTKSPKGITYTIDEIPLLKGLDAPDTAEYLKTRWHGMSMRDKFNLDRKIHICAWFLSPDAWASRGMKGQGGHNIAEQMITATGLPFEAASNDRIGGALLMYNMLKTGKWKICRDKCPNAVKSIQSRVHDPDRPRDVLKIKVGDPLDDVYDDCLIAGTMIATDEGEKPIETLRPGEMVWTRKGLRRVLHAWKSGENRPVHTIVSSDGTELTGTLNHPVYVEGRGFVTIDDLQDGDLMVTMGGGLCVAGGHSAGRADIFNIEVEGENEYFANGILVHNCRYGLYSFVQQPRKPREVQVEEAMTSQDPTTAMIQRALVEAKFKKVGNSISYRRGHSVH